MLQTEYRTIYDQLEESIFVIKEERITHLNRQFKKFIIKFFGPEMLQLVQRSPELAEYNEMIKYNEKNKKISAKILKCFGFICCWRPNVKRVGVENPLEIIEAQEKMLNS